MNVPGSPRVQVWVGLAVAFVGVAVASFAYTGDRQYHIIYVPVAFVGFLLLIGGGALAAWGQARKPRLAPTARRAHVAPRKARTKKEGAAAVKEGEIETKLSCPKCTNIFTARGKPPFDAKCPSCGFTGTIGA